MNHDIKKRTHIQRNFFRTLTLLLAMVLLPFWAGAQNNVTSESDLMALNGQSGTYTITQDITITNSFNTIASFSGTLEANINPQTHMPFRIKNLKKPLFTTLSGTVKNLVLDSVNISGHSGNTGAIACTANGAARIYNIGILSGSVGGTTNTGGLVGLLEGTARVINCYSFATITGGSNVGGIVGNNNATTTATSINTMVMNCMFYGDITGGSTVSPVYGGTNIDNLQNNSGLNTFNYYAYSKLKSKSINVYNSVLAIEERFLTRFEIYRQLLNSNKKLAAWYATGSVANGNQMLKWVLETADRTIANPKPYPVLKAQGNYPSIINPDIVNAPDSATVGRNHGGKLGKTLSVTIRTKSQKTDGGQSWPTAEGSDVQTTSLTLTRTDMDGDRYNFNYDKVQLPYYNDIGTGNYTEGRVVTGWKITGFTGGTTGTYTAVDSWGGYNFADRNCTNKDKYSVSGRVFSQGAYWDVPYGVTDIEIEPYWGYAAFVADERFDYVFTSSYGSKTGITAMGKQVESSTIFNGISVKTSINNALGTIASPGSTVYDNAIVLVGNFHQSVIKNTAPFNSSTPFTIMSVDEDNDHEPDYSLIYHDNDRSNVCPIRFDFLNIPGTAQAQKPNGTGTFLNASVFVPQSWFEITNTCIIYFSQFEYERSSKTAPAPIILLGGVYDQFVSTKDKEVKNTTYLHVGGNAWFHDFANGTHSDGSSKTKHIPISVTGGDYEGFYLTGTYKPDAAVSTDNAECYISGGHFIELAGAGQEQINGNVQWQIYNADIEKFYGGGINAAKPIKGTITTDIYNSHVGLFCGGPKFGNMQTEKKVTTNAEGCVFGTYFGAGYGGNSISRKKYYDKSGTPTWSTLEGYYTGDKGKYYDGSTTQSSQQGGSTDFGKKGPGIATDFEYEFFVWTSGTTGARLFVKFAYFSLAQCNDVSSTLTRCIIDSNFYGGGSLGKVSGTATSVLDNCIVRGNVFGAGYSATLPQVPVRSGGFKNAQSYPSINKNSGMFEPGVLSDTSHYDWKQVANYPNNNTQSLAVHDSIITTTVITKENLGSVGTVTVTLKGNTIVGTVTSPGVLKAGTGNVYGGGDESAVSGNTTVILEDGATVRGNVYGGGNNGPVGGSSEVIIQD